MMIARLACIIAAACIVASTANEAKPYPNLFFYETFDDDVLSTGKWTKSQEEIYKDQPLLVKAVTTAIKKLDVDKGLSLSQENKHYGVSAKFATPLDVKGKDLVVQYDLRLEDGLPCGGAYIKLLRDTPTLNLKKLNGDTPYTIMFGPDKCANNNKVHFIIQHQNPVTMEYEEKHYNTTLNIKTDKARTHLYTLVIKQNNDFEMYIDKRLGKKGNLLTHMKPPVNPSPTMDDPTDSKPTDWVEEDKMDDPSATKPEDWDEDARKMVENAKAVMPKGWSIDGPEQIPDPTAVKPSGWDDEEDGVWEAPLVENPACDVGCGEWKRPMMLNPAYKGKWKAPKVPNPAYRGLWTPRQIPNPHYFEDKNPASSLAPMAALAVEVWTTTAGIHFDNFCIAEQLKDAFAFADSTYGVKEGLETKRAAVEKRDEERKKGQRQRSERFQQKGNWENWHLKLEANWEEFLDRAMENAFLSLAAVVAVILTMCLSMIEVVNKRSAQKKEKTAAAAVGAGAGATATANSEPKPTKIVRRLTKKTPSSQASE